MKKRIDLSKEKHNPLNWSVLFPQTAVTEWFDDQLMFFAAAKYCGQGAEKRVGRPEL